MVQLGNPQSGGTRLNDNIDSGMDTCGIREEMKVKFFLEIASVVLLWVPSLVVGMLVLYHCKYCFIMAM